MLPFQRTSERRGWMRTRMRPREPMAAMAFWIRLMSICRSSPEYAFNGKGARSLRSTAMPCSSSCAVCRSRMLFTSSGRETGRELDLLKSERLLCAISPARCSSDEAVFARATRSAGHSSIPGQKIEHVASCFQRVLDLVADRGGDAPGDRQLFRRHERANRLVLFLPGGPRAYRGTGERLWPAPAQPGQRERLWEPTLRHKGFSLLPPAGYTGHQTVISSIRRVPPQATIKVPNATRIQM